MEKTEIIIWGTGYIAELSYNILKNFTIIAAIDSNKELQGGYWHNIPIISFEKYLKTRNNFIIIITPYNNGAILNKLKSYNYDNFLLISDLFPYMFNNSDNKINTDKTYEQLLFINKVLILLYQERECTLKKMFEHIFFNRITEVLNLNKSANLLQNAQYPYIEPHNDVVISTLEIISNQRIKTINSQYLPENIDLFVIHGLDLNYPTVCYSLEAQRRNIPIIFEEDGFLYSIEPYNGSCPVEFRKRYSIIMDTENYYINAHEPSTMERILNSNKEFSSDEITRAQNCIKLIIKEKISKYNHQPIIKLNVNENKTNILIVDQVHGDKSIKYGMANEDTFLKMFETALNEYPDSEIYIKSHPVKNKGHFNNIENKNNIHFIDYDINPIALLEQMDVVYVCTSQLGFEALMCGKEVHVFGVPFYAGWGVTIDYQKCDRRNKKRSVEEIFYVAYIMLTTYVSYTNNNITDIETVINELVDLRKKYIQYKENENF